MKHFKLLSLYLQNFCGVKAQLLITRGTFWVLVILLLNNFELICYLLNNNPSIFINLLYKLRSSGVRLVRGDLFINPNIRSFKILFLYFMYFCYRNCTSFCWKRPPLPQTIALNHVAWFLLEKYYTLYNEETIFCTRNVLYYHVKFYVQFTKLFTLQCAVIQPLRLFSKKDYLRARPQEI